MKAWLKAVREGCFSAIPAEMTFRQGGRDLATLIDGLAVVGSAKKCATISALVLREVDERSVSSARPLDQLIALNWASRAGGPLGAAAGAYGPGTLDALVWSICASLATLSPQTKAGLMAAIEPVEDCT